LPGETVSLLGPLTATEGALHEDLGAFLGLEQRDLSQDRLWGLGVAAPSVCSIVSLRGGTVACGRGRVAVLGGLEPLTGSRLSLPVALFSFGRVAPGDEALAQLRKRFRSSAMWWHSSATLPRSPAVWSRSRSPLCWAHATTSAVPALYAGGRRPG
jgi:hypothetical protein